MRNCEGGLASDVGQILKALAFFKNVHWYIVESDSTDSTLKILNDFKSTIANFEFLSLGTLEPSIPLRTERIAFCRNKYLTELRDNVSHKETEYLIVADLDGVQDLLTSEGLMSCFKYQDWSAMTANQMDAYYDVWALRHEYWSPNDCWQEKSFYDKFKVGNTRSFFTAVYSRMLNIPENTLPIEVDSAFGGLGVYKVKDLGNALYHGLRDKTLTKTNEVSEHVAFHREISQLGGKIYINPKMINTGLNQHTKKGLLSPHFQVTSQT